ncbi:MAG: hypothetical protein GEEBNDBF_00646 [bacterium]|nr:hypothetical protein [bacterium]
MNPSSFVTTWAPSENDPIAVWADRYISDFDLGLVVLAPGTKAAIDPDWPKQPLTSTGEAQLRWDKSPTPNLGVHLESSRILSLDVDDVAHCRRALAAAGVDLDQLLGHGVAIQGHPAKAKRLYAAPAGETFRTHKLSFIGSGADGDPEKSKKATMVLELRCQGAQDVFPPSIHPDTGGQYRFLPDRDPWTLGGFPKAPESLLQLWRYWDTIRPRLSTALPRAPESVPQIGTREIRSRNSSAWDRVRREILQRLSIREALSRLGASPGSSDKLSCPLHPPDRHPSAWIWQCPDGIERLICAHGVQPAAGIGVLTDGGYLMLDSIDLEAHRLSVGAGRATTVLAHELGIPVPQKKSPPLTDSGNAERMVQAYRDRICHCHSWKKWLVWTGSHWAEDRLGKLQQFAKLTARSLYEEASKHPDKERRAALAKWALKSESAAARRAAIALAESEPGIPILPEQLNSDPWLLNVANGTIDLRTGTIRSHDPANRITAFIHVPFDPTAACPVWEATLLQIMGGEQAMVDYLARALGYALTGVIQDHVLFFLHGKGRNGKTTVLNTVRRILGSDYALEAPPDLLIAKRNDTHPTERAALYGKRFVTTVETERGRRFAEARLKQLTGGDPITARRMHEDFWTFEPSHKLFLAGNHKPQIGGTDDGIWSRIHLIPFTVSFRGREDTALAEKLEAEQAGILAWLVRGCLNWRKLGLNPPPGVVAAGEAYRQEMDTLAGFISERCQFDPVCFTAGASLYDAYCEWVKEETGEQPLNRRAFNAGLEERGCHSHRSAFERGWRGISLRSASSQDEVQ